jgi:hypothetical protein
MCASKVIPQRSEEIDSAVRCWQEQGGTVLMVTLTLQHALGDSLLELHRTLNAAYRNVKAGQRWKLFKQRVGYVGAVTAREYTHGAAGWHPHLHALLFVGQLSASQQAAAAAWLRAAWSAAVGRLGGWAHLQHGCNVVPATDGAVAEYLTSLSKTWSVGSELARANSKIASAGGRSIGQLLAAAGAGDDDAAALFAEYANATFRQNQLVWTRGLRARLGLGDERSDEELAAAQDDQAELLVVFDRGQWRVILTYDIRAETLLMADKGDEQRVAAFVAQFGIELDPEQLRPTCAADPHELTHLVLGDTVSPNGGKMTEQELEQICIEWGVTLRKRSKLGIHPPHYEVAKRVSGKVRTVYLFAVSRLADATREAVEAKLARLTPTDQ